MKKRNKKAQGLNITMVAVLILAVVVVVIVIIYSTDVFKTGKGSFGQFFGGKENTQDVVNGCKLACTSGAEVDFCQRQRSLRFFDGEILATVKLTCARLAAGGTITVDSPKDHGEASLPPISLGCSLPCS